MIPNVLGAVALLAVTLRAIAERCFRRRVAVEAADAAFMHGNFASLFGASLIVAAALRLFQVMPMILTEEDQVVEDRRDNQQSRHPVANGQTVAESEPHQQGEPFDLDRQDQKDVNNEIGKHASKGQEDRAVEKPVTRMVQRTEVPGNEGGHDVGDEADQQKGIVADDAPLIFERCATHVKNHPIEERPDQGHWGRNKGKG